MRRLIGVLVAGLVLALAGAMLAVALVRVRDVDQGVEREWREQKPKPGRQPHHLPEGVEHLVEP